MRRLLFGIGFSALLVSVSFAQDNSLQVAIDAAVKSEPTYQALLAGNEIAAYQTKFAKAESLPKIGLQGSYGISSADYFGAGYKEIYPRDLTIALEQNLYDGGKALSKITEAQMNEVAINGQTLNAHNLLVVEVVKAYGDLAIALKGVQFAQDNLNAMHEYAKTAKLQFDAGEVAISQKAFADAYLAQAEGELANANANLKMAKANLYRLTGIEFESANIQGIAAQIPVSDNDARQYALSSHPLLASGKARLAQAEAMIKNANAQYSPNISISARASSVRDEFLGGYKADSYGAYLNFSMPLYSAARISSGISMAKAARNQAAQSLQATQRAIEMGVTNSYAKYDASMKNLAAAKSALAHREIALKSVEAELKLGERPLKDELDARRDYSMAQMNLLRAEADFMVAGYNIIAALGGNL